ncbi:MAG: leucyl/phenylalanyl-tRNA--protein transferase [Casimicrobiaceae bacterium]
MIHWLQPGAPFPPIERAMVEPNGLLAAGGDLSTERLLDAYRHGIFPWYSGDQPILWWSPDPRMVLFVDELKVARSLRRTIDKGRFEIRVDTAFLAVVRECAAPRDGQRGTWITTEIAAAYHSLHQHGHAHSVEAWSNGELVGGLYGVAIGRMFFGESMFARATDASKVALAYLVDVLRRQDVPLIDCQQQTAHLTRLGARPIARREFAVALSRLVNSTPSTHAWRAVEPVPKAS